MVTRTMLYLFAFSQLTSRCKSVKTEKCQRLKNHDWLRFRVLTIESPKGTKENGILPMSPMSLSIYISLMVFPLGK